MERCQKEGRITITLLVCACIADKMAHLVFTLAAELRRLRDCRLIMPICVKPKKGKLSLQHESSVGWKDVK
jgi:hypothetical protein